MYFGVSPSGKAVDFDSAIRRFESCHPSLTYKYNLQEFTLIGILATLKLQVIFKTTIWKRKFNL